MGEMIEIDEEVDWNLEEAAILRQTAVMLGMPPMTPLMDMMYAYSKAGKGS
jgi:hypothetical protein